MGNESLKKDLVRLRAEVNQVAKSDPEAQRRLTSLINDLEKRIASPSDKKDHGLIENVRNEISNFETEHPRATAILNDIMVTLSNIGI